MTDEIQHEPGLLRAAVHQADPHPKRGKLNIFFGMAPGVGKTHAMLQAACREKLAGRDVVIGYVETHGSPATNALAEGLPRITLRQVLSREPVMPEMDLDSVLARKPQLTIVGDLAHTNVPGSRHPKRYQDVLELLDAGIDVYATLNVQHVASRADTVHQITGATVGETVPDSVLDAAGIELIDLPPEELLKRLGELRAHSPEDAARGRPDLFRLGNLMALREMALRLVAERAGYDVRNYMQKMRIHGPWKSGHRLLVAVDARSSSEQVLRWTRRLADSLHSPWVALYVESPRPLAEVDLSQVTRNLALARKLGAEVFTTTDEDMVGGLLRVASRLNVTQIIVEKPPGGPFRRFFQHDAMLRRLVRESGQMDVHAIPVHAGTPAQPRRRWQKLDGTPLPQYLTAAGVVLAVTLAAFLFAPLIGAHATALVFLLSVVVLALFVGRGPTLVAATMSALLWDYFFLPPIYAFRITHFEDAMLLGTYFVVALVLGQLTARIRAQEEAERQREERATNLYLLTRELTEATDLDSMLHKVMQQMERAFKARIAVLMPEASNRRKHRPHPASSFKINDEEQRAATWVFEHGQPAGKFTDNLPLADALFVPLTTSSGTVGVMGLRLGQSFPPTIHQRNLLEASSQQIALALDRHRLKEVSERAKLLAESERLSKTLLNSVSHEIRTPIAAIKSATSNLVECGEADLSLPRQAMVAEIQEATERLNRLVGNVLDITRLESGSVRPKLNECDVSDLIHVAVNETEKNLLQHRVTIEIAAGLPLVRMDFVLMQQALMNLLSNAAFHTPAGTAVQISVRVVEGALVLVVADRGPGIPAESLERIFDKFYRAPTAPTGGTGLGLSLVKGFVEAQGGQVQAENRADGGAVFTIRLPLDRTPAVSAEANL